MTYSPCINPFCPLDGGHDGPCRPEASTASAPRDTSIRDMLIDDLRRTRIPVPPPVVYVAIFESRAFDDCPSQRSIGCTFDTRDEAKADALDGVRQWGGTEKFLGTRAVRLEPDQEGKA